MEKSERGFLRGDPHPSRYGGEIQAYVSSSAEPSIWVRTECPADLNVPNGPTVEAVAHLTLDEAKALADDLNEMVKNHFLTYWESPEITKELIEEGQMVEDQERRGQGLDGET